MVTLEKGSRMKFVEIEQQDISRRFLVPDLNNLEARIASIAKTRPDISLVRIGNAIVTSLDDTSTLDGLLGIPSSVEHNYVIDLCGDHPVLGAGVARYSSELIAVLEEANISNISLTQEKVEQGQMSVYDMTAVQADNPSPVATAPAAPKPDLAASLRAQLSQQSQTVSPAKEKINNFQADLNAKLESRKNASQGSLVALPKEVSVEKTETKTEEKSLPTPIYVQEDEIQKRLNQAIEEKAQKSKAAIIIGNPRPQGKLDIILERVERIEKLLLLEPQNEEAQKVVDDSSPTSKMTPEQLQAWFWEQHDNEGPEHTFALLVSMMK